MLHESKETIMKAINRNSLAAGLVATMSLALAAPAYARGPMPDPAVKEFQRLVDAAYAKYKGLQDGKNADYIPILTETPSDLFGVVIVTKDGKVFSAGDVDYQFSIQSVSKPFTAALVMTQQGPSVLKEKIGVEPTGMAFNSKLALGVYEDSVNPLVNAGAIAAVSLVQAKSEAERWNKVQQNMSDFAGRPLTVLEKVYESEYTTAFGNRGIANLLYNWGRLYSEPEEALRLDVHRGLAGQDRRRWRDRCGRARSVRDRCVFAAPERSRQQRPFAERHPGHRR